MNMIGLASDHAGFPLKQHVKEYLEAQGIKYYDYGTYSEESCDYPDFGHALARGIEAGECEQGIAICGSGEGISITLNKHQGIRAALCWKPEIAHLARQHNDANVLVMPGRFITNEEADAIMNEYLQTPFEGGRHERRIAKIPVRKLNMAGKSIIALCLVFISLTGHADNKQVIRQSDGSITFVVDEGIEPIEEKYRHLSDGEKMAKAILNEDKTILNDAYNIVASSFEDAKNLRGAEKDAFFQCVLRAYKTHKSLTLSPDMIWLLISQGFARYVDAHSEEVRPKLVSHAGKMDLAIEIKQDLLSEQADYDKLIGDFASQIEKYTRDDIAQTLTADFSTTLPAERIASQITLMESVKSYFEYMVYYLACGIPTITLKGTPADWQRVLDKTRKLAAYGLAEWTRSLEPILEQFVLASEGQPNQKFWQDIVKKGQTDRLRGGGCSNEKPTMLDGWLLRLFPDENGQTPDSVHHQKEMPSQRVYVGLKYRMIDPEKGTLMSETPMELMAGFIGAEEDTLANMLTPKIGWLLRKADKDEDLLSDLQKKSEESIDLKVKELPKMLAQLPHIKSLKLHFTDGIVLSEWFDKINFDYISIDGKVPSNEDLLKVLAKISHIEGLSIYFNQESDISYLCVTCKKQDIETQPETLDNEQHIKRLGLNYADIVVLPEWLSQFHIDHLTIEGKMTKSERRSVSKSLKKANIGKFVIARTEED